MLTVCTHLYQAVNVHAIWYQTLLFFFIRKQELETKVTICTLPYLKLFSVQCTVQCTGFGVNTVKRADCLVFSHGRTVVNRDCHMSRHSSLVDRGLGGAGLMITRADISLPMHCCFRSQK